MNGVATAAFCPCRTKPVTVSLADSRAFQKSHHQQPLYKSGSRSCRIKLDRLFLRPLPVRSIRLGLVQSRPRFPCLIPQKILPSSDQYSRSCASTRSAKSRSLCSRLILHLLDSSLSGDAETGIFFNVRLLCYQLSFHVSPLCALGRQWQLLIDRGPA